jgi:riboflavin biosynthesis pyrimidine reductase
MEWPYDKIPTVVLTGRGQEKPTLSDGLKLSGGPRVASSIEEVVTIIETGEYKQVWVDGGVTLGGFLERDLIDAMILTTVPVMLGGEGGGGLSLWDELRLGRDVQWTCGGCEVMEGLVGVRWMRMRGQMAI